jgi:ABC-2 type transport system permease protein
MTNSFNQHYFDLLWTMTMKEFTVRYKQAAFGFLWILLNPLLQMLVMGAVFSYFMPIKNYPLFLFTGLLPWQFFSLTLNKVTPCFVYERALLQKSSFPREIIPLSLIFSNFINFLISEILLLIVVNLITPLSLIAFCLFLISSLWILVLTTGVSFLTSSLNVRFRDIAFFVQTLVTIWFYATPILYALETLPRKLAPLMMINPLVSPLSLMQSALLNHIIPNSTLIEANLIITVIICFLGFKVFRHQSPLFTDWL